ncbi:MAG: hypothetical protein LT105_08970, partial [Lentimicrobium sp.]|nr:hypothetical protein [Lentimicrobium sp.]
MIVGGKHFRTVWMESDQVFMIDQNKLPFVFEIKRLITYEETCQAIENMTVRGAGAIGAAAGFAMAQAFMQGIDPITARQRIRATR